MNQIQCDNLGMTRDVTVSALSKGQDGITNFAFENHNIRILAVNDNTKFAVTNEKSTKYENSIAGIFLGGCVLNHYLTLFIKNPNEAAGFQDFIYRLYYDGTTVHISKLYQGNLNFSLEHPIEALGYYESEEVQKVYWVDGYNQNRFINIAKEVEGQDIYGLDLIRGKYTKSSNIYSYPDGDLCELYDVRGVPSDVYVPLYGRATQIGDKVYHGQDLALYNSMQDLEYFSPPAATITTIYNSIYNDYSFDFQGRIESIPQVTIEKNYNKAGTFQAGTIQYFITYYNKYGVETCIVWNSDLQYLTLNNRGAKADEPVSCSFDFEITNIDTNYDYLRIYACYRSGLNGTVSSKILTDINLSNKAHTDVIKFTDLGTLGINFNSQDMAYIGGQKIIGNTLDYKQDTLFFGDIFQPDNNKALVFPKKESEVITDLFSQEIGDVTIREGVNPNDGNKQFLIWSYKYVSPIATGQVLYQYDMETKQSQEEIAGFKWREVYRFGIQFMDHEGSWTSAYWLGDKYCDLRPRTFDEGDTVHTEKDSATGLLVETPWPIDTRMSDVIKTEYYDNSGNLIDENDIANHPEATARETRITYEKVNTDPVTGDVTAVLKAGCYIATIKVDINAIKNSLPSEDFDGKYIAYRLLVADTDITNRRIVEQGVINPTMFNYYDRCYNRPFSIPSYLFRPRGSKITNRHYDTLPIQSETNAELQGIINRKIPGFQKQGGNKYNSFMFIFAANAGSVKSGYIQWKLIYYNSGDTDLEKAERLYLSLYTGVAKNEQGEEIPVPAAEIQKISELVFKYKLPVRHKSSSKPGDTIVNIDYSTATVDTVKSYISTGYIPTHIYGSNYKVISSRWEHYKSSKDKQGSLSSWSDLRGWLVDEITDDMRNTTETEVGTELAGHIVVSPAMLPDNDLIKEIACAGSDAAEIALAVVAALTAAAAVVISALSFGTLAAPMAIATAAAIGAATSALAGAAVGAASAAAVLDIQRQDMSDLCKTMLSMGYLPVGDDNTSLGSRKQRSKFIGMLLDKFFSVNGYVQNSKLAGFNSWNVPQLYGEPSTGKPFRTGHPYTEYGCIGEDFNAFCLSGKLSNLDEGEIDLKKKMNLFGIDESIVTLNSPDVEENVYIINESEALKLDLVGMIPVEATYGMYELQTENGLNSNSQVLQGRFKTSKLGEGASSAIGMLNGDIYQDFKAEEAIFDASHAEPQVQSTVDTYRIFMWNRETSAGFWFPNVTPKDGVDEHLITEPRSRILYKIYANMRYSTNTEFYTPFALKTEAPIVCMDAEAMLKVFDYSRDKKNYYENVDTISINDSYYPLICSGNNYPQSEQRITNAGLKDPVHIRYKETPHIVIPLSWYNNGATILPYLQTEEALMPTNLYTAKDLEGIDLYGIVKSAPEVGATYYYLEADDYKQKTSDDWGINDSSRILTMDELMYLTELVHPSDASQSSYSLQKAVDTLRAELNSRGISKTKEEIMEDSHINRECTGSTDINVGVPGNPELVSAFKYAVKFGVLSQPKIGPSGIYPKKLSKGNNYLLHVTSSDYYTLSYDSAKGGWVSVKVTTLPINSKLIISSLSGEASSANSSLFSRYDYSIVEETDGSGVTTVKWGLFPVEYDSYTSISSMHWMILRKAAFMLKKLGLAQLENNGTSQYSPITPTETSLKIEPEELVDMPELATNDLVMLSTPGIGYAASTNPIVYNGDSYEISNYQAADQYEITTSSVLAYKGTVTLKKSTDTTGKGKFLKFALTNYTNILIQDAYFVTKNSPKGQPLLSNLSANIFDSLSKFQAVGTWNQDMLPWRSAGSTPYLFMGELVKKVFDYNTWNGGYSDNALQQLIWNVASKVTPINDYIYKAWGDTFYQRWECEKTYPFTEQDTNSNVEVLSFMLESHNNLDGRCDVNRGINNLLNTRPSNTMFNPVYSQKDNFFSYQLLDAKFEKRHFEADVIWSLTKNNLDDIDKWTSLLAVNEMSLDGRFGTVRKILNVNDVLVAFQDTGIADIKYNETAALNTTSGLPLQMGNTGKVDGYRMVSDTIGCHNKFSLNKNSAGVFFADDHNRTYNQLVVNGGITDISTRAEFSSWFKKNLNGHIWNAKDRDNFRASYDEITHDLYLVKNDPDDPSKNVCLVYNTLLGKFTSFMDYLDTPMIARLISDTGESDSFAIHINNATRSIVQIWKMFAGDIVGQEYGYIYGKFAPYSMEYRLNPDPMHDSIFTNYCFTADWTDPTKEVDGEDLFDNSARRYTSFDEVEAKNEYQKGVLSVIPKVNGYNRAMGRQPLKSMFRVWRGDIPRDGDAMTHSIANRDRMRNPWIHLKFTKNVADNSKMTFHNLTVTYYNQYGRV